MQKRRTQLLRTSQARIEQTLKQEYTKLEGARDRELEDRLTKAAAEIKRKIAEDRAKAAENSSMWTSVGAIVGTALGVAAGVAITVATAGAGAPVGAAAIAAGAGAGALAGKELGAGAGGLIGSATQGPATSMSREEIRRLIRGGK